MNTQTVKFTNKQYQAFDLLKDPKIERLLYGGAKGGGKSVFGCYWVFIKAVELIRQYNIQCAKYPLTIGFMGRKRAVDFNDTTLETWKRFIPQGAYRIRAQEKEIIINDRVKIAYGGFDDEANIKKFNSAEFIYGFIDQAEEVTQDDIALLRGTLRLQIDNQKQDHKILLTANPANCWLVDEFITELMKGNYFLRALPTDNPYLPDGYVDNLRDAFKHRPELIKAYIYGDWSIVADAMLVIKPQLVMEAVKRRLFPGEGKITIGCDPAGDGADEIVIYCVKDGQLIDEDIFGKKDVVEIAGRCIKMDQHHNADLIINDSTGMGIGVEAELKRMGHAEKTLGVNFAASATIEPAFTHYKNMRAEIYDTAARMFYNGEVSIPNDRTLIKQLSHINYKKDTSAGLVQIESKDDIKARMSGQSPDRADALVLALWGQTKVDKDKFDYKRNQQYHQPLIGAAALTEHIQQQGAEQFVRSGYDF